LLFVGRCDQDTIRATGDHGVQDWNLRDWVEIWCALEIHLDAKFGGGGLCAFVHGDVKPVGGQTGNQGDFVLFLGGASGNHHGKCC
jgi:hypothetical protein